MTNSRRNQVYAQGFDCKYITFKKAVNKFERMDNAESIYEGVLGPSHKKLLGNIPPVMVTEEK